MVWRNLIPLGGLLAAVAWPAGALVVSAHAQPEPGIEILSDSAAVPVEPITDEDRTFQIRVDDGDEEHTIQISVGTSRGGGRDGIVRFGEDITIHEGEFVDGDVVAMGGTIVNRGRVSGDIVGLGGTIILGPGSVSDGDVVCVGGMLEIGDDARVDGDAVSVWGRMKRADTSEVRGEIVEVGSFGGITGLPFAITGFSHSSFLMDLWGLLRRLLWVGVMALIGMVLFQVFPSRMGRVHDIAREDGMKAFLVGLAGWILWLPVFVALLITIVGIPVAILLIFLTPVMVLFGYLGVAAAAGERFDLRFGGEGAGIKRAMVVGLLVLEGGVIAAKLVKVAGTYAGVLDVIAGVIGLLGYCVIFVAGTVGFGALILSRFRPREKGGHEAAAGAEHGGAQPAFGGGTRISG